MKFIAIIFICIFACEAKADLTKEECMEAFRKISADCVANTGATAADVEVMMNHLPAQNKETKCLRACVMKKFNVMNEEGKFVREIALKLAELYTEGDAKKMHVAEEVTSVCKDIAVPDDHCEAAEVYKMCMTEETEKRGIKIMS